MGNKPQGFDRLKPLFVKAGLPEERHEEFVEMINGFTTLMGILINANQDVAPNYLTLAMITPEEERFELTVQKCGGKTPCEIIDDLKDRIKDLENLIEARDDEAQEYDE